MSEMKFMMKNTHEVYTNLVGLSNSMKEDIESWKTGESGWSWWYAVRGGNAYLPYLVLSFQHQEDVFVFQLKYGCYCINKGSLAASKVAWA